MDDNPNDYVAVIRRLPRPTVAQTERFARYVSDAHSWYKHLPIRPKVPFVFYLDPGAGMNHVRTHTGELALVEITDESTRFHYTWQKTEDYRRRFGCWNYHASYGTAFMFAGEGGMVSTASAGLKILTDTGDWALVPPDLADKGAALVNAFVHPLPNIRMWAGDPARFGLPEIPDADEDELPPAVDAALRCLWNIVCQDCCGPRLGERIPSKAREAIQHLVDDVAYWGEDWDWPDESWLDKLRAPGLEPGTISTVVKYAEVERGRSRMARSKRGGSREWPTEVVRPLSELLLEERGRQLLAMTDAMNRFAEGVYSTTGDLPS